MTTNLIMPTRRRFLFASAAIVASSSLMPGHSIEKLLFTRYGSLFSYGLSDPDVQHYGVSTGDQFVITKISQAEYAWNREQMRRDFTLKGKNYSIRTYL